MYFDVYSRMRSVRVVPVSVNADGTLAITNRNVTVTKPATGRYVITLDRSMQQTLFGFPTPVKDGVARHICQVPKAAITAKALEVKTYDYSDVAADSPFDILLVGSDGRGSIFNVIPTTVMATLSKPRLIPVYYDGVNNSIHSKNRWDVTVNKTGTGIYAFTFRRKFQQVPYVIAVTNSLTRAVEVTGKTNAGFTIESVNSSSAAAADSEVFILVLGSDDRRIIQRREHILRAPQPFTFLNPYEYDGSADAMVRGAQYISSQKLGTGDYKFTYRKSYPKASFGIVTADGAATLTAVNNRTNKDFKVAAEVDGKVYGLDVGYSRGRDQA